MQGWQGWQGWPEWLGWTWWFLLALPLTLWSAGALAFAGGGSGAVPSRRKLLALLYLATVGLCVFALPSWIPAVGRWAPLTPIAGFVVVLAWFKRIAARNSRTWSEDQSRLPAAEIDESAGTVTLRDVRDFRYHSPEDWDARWYDATYRLATLRRAYFIVEPFKEFEHAAHTMVSFEFEADDGTPQFVAISVEIRKERGESFSALRGLYRQYEIMYVVADERDAVQLRSNYRDDTVYVYPVAATPEAMRAYFLDMCRRLNALRERPEYYNTATNTCTTNLVDHLRRVSDTGAVPFDPRVLMPAWSDQLVHRMGLIDTTGVPNAAGGPVSLEALRAHFAINARAAAAQGADDFSARIRASC